MRALCFISFHFAENPEFFMLDAAGAAGMLSKREWPPRCCKASGRARAWNRMLGIRSYMYGEVRSGSTPARELDSSAPGCIGRKVQVMP